MFHVSCLAGLLACAVVLLSCRQPEPPADPPERLPPRENTVEVQTEAQIEPESPEVDVVDDEECYANACGNFSTATSG